MLNILMFDNNGIFGAGIQAILSSEPNMKVVGNFSDKVGIVNAIQESTPDILLVNTFILGLGGFITIEWLKQKYPALKIIFILPESDKNILLRGIHIGVDGFLLYESDPSFFVESMRNIFKEEMILSGKLAKLLLEEFISEEKKELLQRLKEQAIHLTARESDLVYLIYKGYRNKEMADALKLSAKTIRDYVSKLYKKIGLYSRIDVYYFLGRLMIEKDDNKLKVMS
ncbi:response regulator transcription factor [Terribacillus aidingensis]|uniref:response regulator transcription factor n=1 Tax=Terribacillus aidingensis TaxID=586416 RepID=UPI00345042F7